MFVSALSTATDDARPGTARASGAQNGTAMSDALASTVVVVTGCGGPAGQATVRRLLTEGSVVVGADANGGALTALAQSLPAEQGARFHGHVVDLLDEAATRGWAAGVLAAHGRVDGVAHLVGGWRGGKSFNDNTLSDSDWLFSLLLRTLQTVSLSFHDALVASPSARFVIISATAAQQPSPGSASYSAAKAAAETWTFALAASFAALQAGGTDDPPLRAAATALVVKALLTDAMRAEKPDAAFAGYTHVDDLAAAIVGLWDRDASILNGTRLELEH
jgi:NAD(P)-dependent dehydrogenase (short-subunit alcohol dehydrogenase family)